MDENTRSSVIEFADVGKSGQMVNSEDDRGERPIFEHWYSR